LKRVRIYAYSFSFSKYSFFLLQKVIPDKNGLFFSHYALVAYFKLDESLYKVIFVVPLTNLNELMIPNVQTLRKCSVAMLLVAFTSAANSQTQYTVATNPIAMSMSFPSRMILADYDNDGDIDFLYQTGNTAGTGIGYAKNNGNGIFTDYPNASSPGTPFATFSFAGQQISTTGLFPVDYDNDGDIDIIDREAAGGLGIWKNNGGTFALASTDPLTMTMTNFPSRMIFGDFDNDGDADILYQNGNVAGTGIGYAKNNGSGTFTDYPNANSIGTPFTSFDFTGQQITPASVFVFDYDNDGDVDIIDRDIQTSLGIWRNNNGTFAPATNTINFTSSFPSRMIYGDFDSDGDIDILYQSGNSIGVGFGYMQNPGNGVYVNYTDANNVGTPFTTFNFSNQQLSPAGLFTMDIDNDGDIDILDRENSNSGVLGLWAVAGAPPKLSSSTPVNNATGVSTTSNIVLTFSKIVVSGNGNMYIRRTADNTIIETIPTNGSLVTGLGTSTITINPAVNLLGNTSYYLIFDANAFKDNEGHIFGTIATGGVVLLPITNSNFLSFTTGTALPVKLTSFTANVRNGDVVLDWQTASEQNASHFEVWYSKDSKLFAPLGSMTATGSLSSPASYQYIHLKPLPGNAWYKLKQVDIDGHAEWSPIRMVELFNTSKAYLYPNPAANTVNFELDTAPAAGAVLGVYNIVGSKVVNLSIINKTTSIDLSNFAKGLYKAVYTTPDGSKKTFNFVKE